MHGSSRWVIWLRVQVYEELKETEKKGLFSWPVWVYTRLGRGARDWGERLTTLLILQSFGCAGLTGLTQVTLFFSQGLAHLYPFPLPQGHSLYSYYSHLPLSLTPLFPLTRSQSSLSFRPAGYFPFGNLVTVAITITLE
jgi:hypothetical protein